MGAVVKHVQTRQDHTLVPAKLVTYYWRTKHLVQVNNNYFYNNACTAIDHCECCTSADDCQHVCHNTAGSYYCTCWSGYRVSATNSSACEGNIGIKLIFIWQ